MQGTHDIDQTTTSSDGDGLDPSQAARLLAQTTRDARRQVNLSPPWITAFMGVVILVGYGALWISVRGQHPYQGPSLGAIGIVYAAVAVSIAVSVKVYQTVLGISASRADWPQFGSAFVVVIGGVVAAFVGPIAAWLAAGITIFVAVIGYAAVTGKRLIHF